MSHTLYNVAVGAVQTLIFKNVDTYVAKTETITGDVYTTVFKRTLNFSEIDTLRLYFEISCTVDNGNYKVLVDTTNADEENNQVDGTGFDKTIDCTGYTGEKTLKIQVKNQAAGGTTWLSDLKIYCTEA